MGYLFNKSTFKIKDYFLDAYKSHNSSIIDTNPDDGLYAKYCSLSGLFLPSGGRCALITR